MGKTRQERMDCTRVGLGDGRKVDIKDVQEGRCTGCKGWLAERLKRHFSEKTQGSDGV